jgi:hypothetical protein
MPHKARQIIYNDDPAPSQALIGNMANPTMFWIDGVGFRWFADRNGAIAVSVRDRLAIRRPPVVSFWNRS